MNYQQDQEQELDAIIDWLKDFKKDIQRAKADAVIEELFRVSDTDLKNSPAMKEILKNFDLYKMSVKEFLEQTNDL